MAAAAHACWNLIAKQAGGGTTFVWLFSLCAVALLAPFVAVDALVGIELDAEAIGLMAGSAALHACYFASLQRAYRDGDLSYVYPLARGTGPLLATVAAIVVLDERPSALALLGAATIVLAVLSIAFGGEGRRHQGSATWFALVTGVSIAAYTLWDKHAVDGADLTPEVYLFGTLAVQTLLLTPVLLTKERPRLAPLLPRALAVGALGALAYVLVLYALRLAPVSSVAPAREVSIVFGAALGVGVLAEGDGRRRLAAATAIVVGLVLLTVG